MQLQQERQNRDVNEALTGQDNLQLRNERHGAEIQMMREEVNFLRQMRQEILGEHAVIQRERRSANVLAIMMDYNQHQLQFMVSRIDRLRSLIVDHQMPCPLGDTVLVQENPTLIAPSLC